jgi:hypothetical protein
MLEFVSWDVCAAVAIAVGAMFLVAILDQSPMLLILIIFALCLYIAVQAVYVREQSDDAVTPARDTPQAKPSGWIEWS